MMIAGAAATVTATSGPVAPFPTRARHLHPDELAGAARRARSAGMRPCYTRVYNGSAAHAIHIPDRLSSPSSRSSFRLVLSPPTLHAQPPISAALGERGNKATHERIPLPLSASSSIAVHLGSGSALIRENN
ncbi:hypothetical protein KM043_007082 [Ampulex compressa]|nr:hypothetical protein KM043_007082 [Ampulex compressa]